MDDLRLIKIVVADGHKVVGNAISKVLDSMAEFQVVGLAKSGEEVFRVFESCTPDIVVIDIDLPGLISGLEILRRIHRTSAQIRIIVLTNLLDQAIVHDALQEGVMSYMLKYSSTDELVNAIRSADQGIPTLSPEVTRILIQEISTPNGYQLTSREREILQLLAEGLNNREIAKHLYVSLSTVQFHVSNILNKLGVHNRIEAAMFAVRHKLAS
jgi:NarL family two-component system response regulator LiaR